MTTTDEDTSQWTVGHVAHRAYRDAIEALLGSGMPWEHVSPEEQALWEAAGQGVLDWQAQQPAPGP